MLSQANIPHLLGEEADVPHVSPAPGSCFGRANDVPSPLKCDDGTLLLAQPYRNGGPTLHKTLCRKAEYRTRLERSVLINKPDDAFSELSLSCLKKSWDLSAPLNRSQEFLFDDVRTWRQYVLWAMAMSNERDKKIDTYRTCGCNAVVLREEETSEVAIKPIGCGNRLCPYCRQRFKKSVTRVLSNLAKDWAINSWRMITLTQPHLHLPLAQCFAILRKRFDQLRSSVFWQKHCQYGTAFTEATLSENTGLWHPHIHIVVRSGFIPREELHELWEKILGADSKGTAFPDVRLLHSPHVLSSYLAKYLGKPPKRLLQQDHLPEFFDYYLSMQGFHALWSFGSRQAKLDREERMSKSASPSPQRPKKWKPIYTLEHLFRDADAGDTKALALLKECMTWKQNMKRRFADSSESPPSPSQSSPPLPP